MTQQRNVYLERPSAGTLVDVVDLILDKGLVIDAFVRVSVLGIELLTIDARIVVASVDTYLRFAEAVGRLDLSRSQPRGLPELVEDLQTSGAKGKTKGALDAVGEKISEVGEKVSEKVSGLTQRDRQEKRRDQSDQGGAEDS
jgi:hypothetical protein